MTTETGGQEGTKAARTPEERIRLLLEITNIPNLGDEIIYDGRFNTEEWPHNGYCLQRTDLEVVLKDLSAARDKAAELERDNEAARQDIEDLQNQIEDLKAEQERYEEQHVGSLNQRNIELSARLAEVEEKLGKKEGLISALYRQGAGHWFAFGWDKPIVMPGDVYRRYCRICEKEEGHPAHFTSDATYLDSRAVQEDSRAALERVEKLLHTGLGMRTDTAAATARELLRGLPGIAPTPPEQT